MATSSTELWRLSAVELAALFRQRELSPVEALDATLARIEEVNPAVNAVVTVAEQTARAQALHAEAQLRESDCPPITGVPVSIKDLTPTAGIRTTRGSLLWADWIPDVDAPIVERLKTQGAVILGKTNTSEFGWKADSGNRVFGPTQNPWRNGLTAGGSSGGAAAAVALGMGPLGQGTDGAGSIRIPASFCGVVGVKPSFGLIPYHPPSSVPSLAHIGVIARSIADAALFLDATAGPDSRDPASNLGPARFDTVDIFEGIDKLSVGWSPTLGYAHVDPDIAAICASAIGALSDQGMRVEELPIFDADPFPAVDALWATGQAALHLSDLELVRRQLDHGRLALIERGLTLRGVDVAAAASTRARLGARLHQLETTYDVLITPTVPCPPFAAGADCPASADPTYGYLQWTSFTYPFNLTGNPVVTLPCGLTGEGLPVGLQIVGRWANDASLLRIAAILERLGPFKPEWPPPQQPRHDRPTNTELARNVI